MGKSPSSIYLKVHSEQCQAPLELTPPGVLMLAFLPDDGGEPGVESR